MTVLAIPFLLERGYSAPFAAFAVGLIGFSQIPGRALFATVGGRLPPPWETAGVFALIALGIAVLVSVHGTVAAIAGLVLLGMGNGMATLSRATRIADRYGAGAYGTIGGVAASFTTGARATGPVAAAAYAEVVGFPALLWTLAALAAAAAALAFRAETDVAGLSRPGRTRARGGTPPTRCASGAGPRRGRHALRATAGGCPTRRRARSRRSPPDGGRPG